MGAIRWCLAPNGGQWQRVWRETASTPKCLDRLNFQREALVPVCCGPPL